MFRSNRFRFSNLSNSHYDQSLQPTSPREKSSITIYSTRLSCENALLMASSKHYVLLYNIEISNHLYMFDIQTRQIKEQFWDEGMCPQGDVFCFNDDDKQLFRCYSIESTETDLKKDMERLYFI